MRVPPITFVSAALLALAACSGGSSQSESVGTTTASVTSSVVTTGASTPEQKEPDATGQGQQPGDPGVPGAQPDLTDAAAALGVSVRELQDALGPPPPDLERAAQRLGVTVDELEAVLPGAPEGGGQGGPPQGQGPAVGAQAVPQAAVDAAETGIDITDVILTKQSVDCTDYLGTFSSDVTDLSEAADHAGGTSITATDDGCLVESNNVPNHDFGGGTSNFATAMSPNGLSVTIPANPAPADQPNRLRQTQYNAVMLNGVVLDILSAGCYAPDDPQADRNGNVAIGCRDDDPWVARPARHRG